MAAKKQHFASIQRFEKTWPSYKEKNNAEIIKSGDDNLFPQHIIELYNKSSIHGAAVNAITEGVIGGGLTANKEAFLERANKKGETWNDIFAKVSLDFYLHGSYALEIIWSLDRSRIAEVYHIDFSLVRAREKNHRGQIPGYYLCNDWKPFTKVTEDAVWYLPSFDDSTKQDEPNQIYVVHNYRPGQQYYPLPVYNGALKVIDLDTEIDNFHVNNIKNGLAPSLAITTFMNGADDDVQAVENMLRGNYGGSGNAGSLMYMDVDSPENAPKIEPIPQNGADGYYTTINDLTVQKILTAHRITSPMLLGIKTEGQLGGRAEMIDAMQLFQHNVIEPLQQDVLKCLEYILSYNYPDIVLGVETKTLFEDGTTQEEVVTSVEATDAEDAAIQTDDTTAPLLA
jgi:hypothetical protein